MYYSIIFLASIITVFYAVNIGHSSDSAFVTDARTNVSYQGVSNNGVDSFLNIPFGQDTSGAGRFAPPKPFISSRNKVFNATVAGAACPQQMVPFPGLSGLISNVTDISEDCLNLRIARPSSVSKNAKLPVMVYIYGGGYTIGQIYDSLYTPGQLVLDSVASGTPVIYVAINYRVGIFGFVSSDLLRDQKSLNVGLRDQRLALEWIQENIEVFGGDPNRVTLFGESKGGTSIALHLTAFGGRQPTPFRQAIIESGAVGPGVATQYDAKDFMDTVTAAGCNYRDPDSFMSLECLRSLSLESLLDVELAVGASQSAFIDGLEAFGPVVDGDFIPDAPSRLVQSGRFVETPLIIGWNHDDGSLFTPTSIATQQDVSKLLVKYFPALTKQTLNHILSLYPVSDFSAIPSANVTAQWSRASRIFRDMQFTCPSLFLATHLGDSHQSLPANAKYHPVAKSKANTLQRILSPQQSQSSSVFIYELNQTSFAENLTAQGFPQLGISHIADIPYVFDEVARFNRSASNIRLAKQVTGSWSRFAATGSPSSVKGVSLKGWEPAWKSQANDRLQNARVMVIGGGKPGLSGLEGDEDALQEERLPERCGFLMSEKVIREIGT